MTDVSIRVTGRAGRITLRRPAALNAMTYDMCMAIDAAFRRWREDDAVSVVVLDAEGDKAFCAGGDIAELYATGRAGDFGYGRTFWRNEYRMNALIAAYPKPVVSFLQGFTMGGGVGIGCHGSHRVVGDSSRIAMPECGIGLVPDVGGSYLLARAPGELGKYLGTTAARMHAADALDAGFADHYIPEASWPNLIARLETDGNADIVADAAEPAPPGALAGHLDTIDRLFAGHRLDEIRAALAAEQSDFARDTLKALDRCSPLSVACTLEIVERLRRIGPSMADALALEYRFTWRSAEKGDFLEGIRAQIIDKDRNPQWQYAGAAVPREAVEAMLAPLEDNELTFE